MNPQAHHYPLKVCQDGIARSDGLSDGKTPFFPLGHASRVDGICNLDVVQYLIRQSLKSLASCCKEHSVLVCKQPLCEKLMLNKGVYPVSELEIDLLKLHLALIAFTFYDTHTFFLLCDPMKGPQLLVNLFI